MTVEHRVVLDFSDVRCLRLVCRRCNTAVTFDVTAAFRIPGECPSCLNRWSDQFQPQRTRAVEDLIEAIKILLREQESDSLACRLRLEYDERALGTRALKTES